MSAEAHEFIKKRATALGWTTGECIEDLVRCFLAFIKFKRDFESKELEWERENPELAHELQEDLKLRKLLSFLENEKTQG